jgi:hypothetical protein
MPGGHVEWGNNRSLKGSEMCLSRRVSGRRFTACASVYCRSCGASGCESFLTAPAAVMFSPLLVTGCQRRTEPGEARTVTWSRYRLKPTVRNSCFIQSKRTLPSPPIISRRRRHRTGSRSQSLRPFPGRYILAVTGPIQQPEPRRWPIVRPGSSASSDRIVCAGPPMGVRGLPRDSSEMPSTCHRGFGIGCWQGYIPTSPDLPGGYLRPLANQRTKANACLPASVQPSLSSCGAFALHDR